MVDVCRHEQLGREQRHSSEQREQRREQLAWWVRVRVRARVRVGVGVGVRVRVRARVRVGVRPGRSRPCMSSWIR